MESRFVSPDPVLTGFAQSQVCGCREVPNHVHRFVDSVQVLSRQFWTIVLFLVTNMLFEVA